MKTAFKYLILLSLLSLSISCKKEGIVGPSTPVLPLITNFAPIILTTSSVILSGKIDLRGNGPVTIYFEYGLSNSYGLRSAEQKISSSGMYATRVDNLNPETVYHWRIYCKSTDVITSNDTSFVTILQPIVTNLALTNLTPISATLNGQIDLQGRDSVSAYFEYGLTSFYGSKSPEQFITTSGIFSSTINNLKPATTYHWRIYCKPHDGNSDITTYDSTFTTFITFLMPTITDISLINLTNTSVNISGKIDIHGRSDVSLYTEYGLTPSYGSKSPEIKITSSGTFSVALNNLTPATIYHTRVYCKTTDGDIIGDDINFSTLIEFIYPLNIGQTWTYNYNLFYEDHSNGILRYVEIRNGLRIWKVVSNYSAGDSTIYNLICTARDTVFKSNGHTPFDTTYEEKTIPFTIVVSQYLIMVNLRYTVNIETDNPPISRYVAAGTTQIKFGVILYINGTGLYGYEIGYGCNTYDWTEGLQLLQ